MSREALSIQRLPLAVGAPAANRHEITRVQLSFDFNMIGAKPDDLIGDRAPANAIWR